MLENHIARANPHWQSTPALGGEDAPEAVVIFQGPQEYISPSFYPSKAEHGKIVPTWTYIAIHAHGHLRHTEDPAWLLRHLNEMTDEKEAPREKPWAVNDAPDRYIEARMRGIVGLEITVERLEGSWKLNQNKSEDDQAGTVAGLETASAMGAELAEAWRVRRG
ncbi:FMN-binding negative transcriptional regulator [Ahrensia sp. R2A130]|uniref:FMN-binding negative transcriptional regulator n=1 Tax=Ahrensia sp. R2A130 TaxID=744979 RepID=UPI0001E0D15D|nr:FMN-binding negative transcriptional regulator [Ahrensia sp. R2A130]EFL87694.1 negative transcriptional regulator [Ahrensia sp. R2A130]